MLSREVAPFAAVLSALIVAALLLDGALHLLKLVWIGRYLGIAGVLLILGSFGYSLRKRQLIKAGSPVTLLRVHERMAWTGALLVLVHAGVHFNGVLAWLAVAAMLVNVCSGLTGKYLLQRARRRLDEARKALVAEGVAPGEIADRLHRDSLTLDLIRKWRVVHVPVALAFAVLALAHIVAVAFFWGWS